MGRLIEEDAAVERISNAIWHLPNEAYPRFNSFDVIHAVVEDAVNGVPTAQHDKRTETHACDCISRQAAIDALNGEIEITGRTNAEAIKGYVRLVKDRLERLPSAQPTIESRAKGHWVPQKGGGVCCSECGKYALDEADGRYISVSVKSNFCPNCGADMRGGRQ